MNIRTIADRSRAIFFRIHLNLWHKIAKKCHLFCGTVAACMVVRLRGHAWRSSVAIYLCGCVCGHVLGTPLENVNKILLTTRG